MRIRFWNRLFAALSGLVVLFIGVCIFVYGLGVFPFQLNTEILEGPFELWQRLAMVGVALVLCALGLHSLSLLFRRSREKGFIIQRTEHGDVSISMHAMENMVRKCIDTHEELKASHARIHRTKDGVVVDIKISLASGVNIPLTVNALQKQIKHYITSCSGVDVKEVRVMVETGSHQSPKGAEVMAPDMVAADACVAAQEQTSAASATEEGDLAAASASEGTEHVHQRIFKREEMPQEVPMPPEEIEEEAGTSQAMETEDDNPTAEGVDIHTPQETDALHQNGEENE